MECDDDMKTIEIYFSDLTPDKQKEVLEIIGEDNEKEMNWDIIPMAVIEVDEDV
jgi:hypothetical protein